MEEMDSVNRVNKRLLITGDSLNNVLVVGLVKQEERFEELNKKLKGVEKINGDLKDAIVKKEASNNINKILYGSGGVLLGILLTVLIK
jgi:hypothetical protein